VDAACTVRPLTRVRNCSAAGSGTSSRVTIHGPSAAERGKFLPADTDSRWKSRTLPSMKQQ
jgi:hypothetical protein